MKSLSQSEYGELKDLYNSVYATEEIIEEEMVHEICNELVEELVAEGHSEDDAIALVEDAPEEDRQRERLVMLLVKQNLLLRQQSSSRCSNYWLSRSKEEQVRKAAVPLRQQVPLRVLLVKQKQQLLQAERS